jgi:hypothetical protein
MILAIFTNTTPSTYIHKTYNICQVFVGPQVFPEQHHICNQVLAYV